MVARRFRGPERSGNGGYTAGLVAAFVRVGDVAASPSGVPVTVTLRRPPPLDVSLEVRVEDGLASLFTGETLVATAARGELASSVVRPVDLGVASSARAAYRGATGHPFPGCFVCGPAREPADGLRLTPGLISAGRTACVWVPDPSLAAEDNPSVAKAEFCWAALDCPGGWVSDLEHRPLVLGRMTAVSLSLPRIGRPHTVVGELLGDEGRKTFTATSLYEGGRLVGRAEHTWIAVDPDAFNG